MMKYGRRCLFRVTQTPSVALPMGARSVGHYRVRAGYRDKVAVKDFVQVFWGVANTGALVIHNTEHRLGPQQIAVYFPGMRHEVYALATDWEYCWWTLDGPLAASVTTALGLTAAVYDAGPAPLALFRQLERKIRDPSPAAERQASAMAYRLLTLAASGRRSEPTDPLVREAIRIIHDEWNQPLLCVKQLGDRLRLHRSSLTRRFEKAIGIPPVTYLLRIRIQNALSMLQQTDKPIAEVSRLCGYPDPGYFARLVHLHTGFTPSHFRSRGIPPLRRQSVP